MFKTSLVLAAVLGLVIVPAHAQTLADAAAAAKLIHEDPAWSRVVTNKDLAPVPVTPLAVSELPTSAIADTVVVQDALVVKDEAYWKDRMRVLQVALDTDMTTLTEAQTRLGAYDRMLTNSQRAINGTVYVDRTALAKTLDTNDERGRATARVASDKTAIAALEEEARRASVPPGWLRLP